MRGALLAPRAWMVLTKLRVNLGLTIATMAE